jgi:hypothetical protein
MNRKRKLMRWVVPGAAVVGLVGALGLARASVGSAPAESPQVSNATPIVAAQGELVPIAERWANVPEGDERVQLEREAEAIKGDAYVRTLELLAAEAAARGDVDASEEAVQAKVRFENPNRDGTPVVQGIEKGEVVK